MTYVKTRLKRELVIDSIITIHHFEYMKDFEFHGESHDFWEFLYVEKGTILVQAGEKQLELEKGTIVFHEPNEFHSLKSIGAAAPRLIALSFTSRSPAIRFFRNQCFSLNSSEYNLLSLLVHIAKEALSMPIHLPHVEQLYWNESLPFGTEQLILTYLELFLLTLIRHHFDDNNEKSLKPTAAKTNHSSKTSRSFITPSNEAANLDNIIEYIHFHVCEQLKIEEICSYFSFSRSSLQNLFHKEKGCGPIEYFNSLKIEKAKDMIREGRKNITEISYDLSYCSLQYFSRQFKKFTGMSPKEYETSIKSISHAFK